MIIKPNGGLRKTPSPPLNEVYTAYKTFFIDLLESRGKTEFLDTSVYVPVDSIEKPISDYLESNISTIGLLVGPIGIGKTSVLSHIAASRPDSIDRVVQYINLNSRKQSIPLQKNYESLTVPEQKKVISEAVDTFMRQMLMSKINDKYKISDTFDEIYDFCMKYNSEFIVEESILHGDNKKDTIIAFMKKNINAFFVVCFKYLFKKTRIKSYTLIIDNCDNKDTLLLESFVDFIAHLSECISELNKQFSIDDAIHFKSILAMRPSTFYTMRSRQRYTGLGRIGYHPLYLTEPCSVASIIRRRFEVGNFGEQTKDICVVSRNGMKWEINRRNKFVIAFCERLEKDEHAKKIARLCNYDISCVLRAILEVISNDNYIDLDRIIGDVINEDNTSTERGIPWTSILSVLALGNQAKDPTYPVEGTLIPNIIHSKYAPFNTTSLKLRILYALNCTDDGTLSGSEDPSTICETIQHWFGTKKENIINLLNELFAEGLIETARALPLSVDVNNNIFHSTEKTRMLLEQIQISIHLLFVIRDDLPLDKTYENRHKTSHYLTTSEMIEEVISIVIGFWKNEKNEITKIASNGELNEFYSIMGRRTVSELMLNGIQNNFKNYFKSKFKEPAIKQFETMFIDIEDDISNWTKYWEALTYISNKKNELAAPIATDIQLFLLDDQFKEDKTVLELLQLVPKC